VTKITFKLIPFIISLLIVIISVTGISLYSYYGYENNKLRFVADYFNYETHSSVSTVDQIENFVKFESSYYQNVSTNLTYYDAKSGKEYTSTPSSSSKNLVNGATWSDGVLHLPGYFDIKVYAESTWNDTQEVWVLSYYFFIYNVNYSTADIIDHLYLAFVDGTGTSGEGELYGTTKLDVVMQEIKDGQNGGPDSANLPSYKYSGNISSSYSMYIYDNDATGSALSSTTPYVYRLTTLSECVSETSDLDDDVSSRIFAELESCTFSIFYSGSTDLYSALSADTGISDMKELVRGTFVNSYDDVAAFNTAVNTNGIKTGYQKDLYKAGYGKFIFLRIFIEALITFVISGLLAFLFYLIWQDDSETDSKEIKIIKKKKKKSKEKQKA
jgi:hypothetical protein